MRISTNTVFQTGISKLNNLQADQSRLQQQISTSKRILSPSDDPTASARALQVSAAESINLKYADNRNTAASKLNTIESNLTSVTDLIVAAQSSVVAAGNAGYSNQDRGYIAMELKNSLDSLVALANTKDEAGNYLYAGFKTDTQPFVANASGATYAGDSNQQLLQVDSSRQMAVNVSGDTVFLANGQDVFATLNDLVNLLNTPVTDDASKTALSAGIATAISGLQGSLDNVLNARAGVGTKLNELESLETAGASRDLQYKATLSDLQDLDYASALSDLAKNQIILEAAQKSFVSTTSLSLFQFI